MRIKITSGQLERAMARIGSGISTRSLVESMSGIYLEASDTHVLTVRANNTAQDVRTWRDCNVVEPGTVVVHAGFKEWVYSVSGDIDIWKEGGRLHAQCGQRQADFALYDPKTYPLEKPRPAEDQIDIADALSIIQALNGVQFAMARSSERAGTQGIRFTPEVIVALDGRRGAFSKKSPFTSFDALLSSEALSSLRDILAQSDRVEIAVAGAWIWVRNGELGEGAGVEAWLGTRNASFPTRAITTLVDLAAAKLPINITIAKDALRDVLGYAQTLSTQAKSLNDREYAALGITEDGNVYISMEVKGVGSMYDVLDEATITDQHGDYIHQAFEGWLVPEAFIQAMDRATGDEITISYVHKGFIPEGHTQPIQKTNTWFISCPDTAGQWGVMQSPMFKMSAVEKATKAADKLRDNNE
ncbi:MAG: hypothetical protein OEX12_01270 [Gammaproteobacteria bacterium]|nr:hypothetical protein [Gammaproteobacteria bacterium]